MSPYQFKGGLGRLGHSLTDSLYAVPEEIARDVDPRTIALLKKQALMQLGLGMLAAKDRGAGLGSGINQALQQSQHGLGQGLGQAYTAKRSQREDARLAALDERAANRDELYAENLRQTRMDRMQDNARQDQALQYQKDRDLKLDKDRSIDNARQAALADAQLRAAKTEEGRKAFIGRLSQHVGILTGKWGAKPDGDRPVDKALASVLSRLNAEGVDAYPPQPRIDPFAGMFGGGLGAPAPGQLPPLDGLYPQSP